MENEAIIRKLRALLAKANGTEGPESEAFMTKVRNLLVKHQLEMADLEGEDDPLEQHSRGIVTNAEWQMAVCTIGAQYFGCAAVFTRLTPHLNGCAFYGRHSACVTSFKMVEYWIIRVHAIAEEHQVDESLVGAALTERIVRLLEKQGQAPSNGRDLVPINTAMELVGPTESEAFSLPTTQQARSIAEGISLDLQVDANVVDLRRLK